jgi:hypothetical protein
MPGVQRFTVPGESAQITQAIAVAGGAMEHRQDDVVLLLLELQDELDFFELIAGAKINRGRRTEKIHAFGTVSRPGLDAFEIKPGFFLLKKYSHTLHTAPHQFLLPPSRFHCYSASAVGASGDCHEISVRPVESNGEVKLF